MPPTPPATSSASRSRGRATSPGFPRVLALARVSVAAALGRTVALRRALRAALRAGCSFRHLDEALLQLVPFAGFARAINAFTELRAIHPRAPRGRKPGKGRRKRGEALCRRVYGPVYEKMIARMGSLHPDLAEWILEDGYGRVLARPGLSIRERELIIVAVLSALKLPLQRESHIRGALRVGAGEGEVSAILRAAGQP